MQVQEELERFTSDADYFDQHREQLQTSYPDRWVAVFNHRVVAAAKDMKRLVAQLQRKGVSPGRVYCEYITDKEELLILCCAPL